MLITDPMTKEVRMAPPCSFLDGVRMALISIYQKGAAQGGTRVPQSKLDDIEEKCAAGDECGIYSLNDDEHKMLESEFDTPNPNVFTAAWAFSSKSHRRALAKATDEMPETKPVATTNGKSETAAS